MSKTKTGALFLAVLTGAAASRAQTAGSEPLTLRRAVEIALARAPEVAGARADADEAGASARQADARFHPDAFVSTTPGYSSGLPVTVAGQVPALAGITIRKTLYDPVRRAEALEAHGRAAASAGAFERSSIETVRAVVAAYGRNWADEALIVNARRRLEAREASLQRISALRREGRQTELDVERASLEVARAKQKLSDEQSEQSLDQLELKRLIDWPANEALVLAQNPLAGLPEPGADNWSAARAADPELKALDQQWETLRAAAALHEKAWRPVIEAQAQYLRLANYNNLDQYFVKFKPNDFTVGVSVAVPIWTGGRLAEGRAAARARLERLDALRRARERDLEIAVRRAETQALHAESVAAIAQRASRLAEEDLRVGLALADEGRAEPTDTDRREAALADARDDSAIASQGLLAARVQLLALTGRLPGALLPDASRPSEAAADISIR